MSSRSRFGIVAVSSRLSQISFWGVGCLTRELTLQFGVGFFALPSRNCSSSILEHPWSQTWLLGGAGARGLSPCPGQTCRPRWRALARAMTVSPRPERACDWFGDQL